MLEWITQTNIPYIAVAILLLLLLTIRIVSKAVEYNPTSINILGFNEWYKKNLEKYYESAQRVGITEDKGFERWFEIFMKDEYRKYRDERIHELSKLYEL